MGRGGFRDTPEIGLQQTIPVPRWLENPIDLREVEPMSGQCRLTVCYTGPILTQYVRNMQHAIMTIGFKVIELGNACLICIIIS